LFDWHERFHSIPDHQRKHRIGGVFLVVRQRFDDRPALIEWNALKGRGQGQPDFLAGV
jgi:hypothetical protein